ncbi:MAG: hypothetical protein JST00_04595 [Deltaproteobacteria bacterium]|nr:hypothetical protein [Deltaproteobacteria bacterium]
MNRRTKIGILGSLALAALGAVAAPGCAAATEAEEDAASEEAAVAGRAKLQLTDDQRREMVSKKTTCPFVGTALAMKRLFVYGSLSDPVAVIAGAPGSSALAKATRGSAVAAGGAGDLAQGFRIVARGNHNTSGSGTKAPEGMFSLDFPSSLGAHAAHSFILMGDPRKRDSGRLDENNLHRLIGTIADGGHAERVEGKLVVRRAELGKFVARNVACDPNAVTASRSPFALFTMLGRDIAEFTASAASYALTRVTGSMGEEEKTQLLEDMLKIAVRNNLVGSAAEFGLLTTALEGSPDAVSLPGGETALAVDDIELLFAGKKVGGKYDPLTRRLPSNWDTSPKTIARFLVNTIEIMKVAGIHNLANTYGPNDCPSMR